MGSKIDYNKHFRIDLVPTHKSMNIMKTLWLTKPPEPFSNYGPVGFLVDPHLVLVMVMINILLILVQTTLPLKVGCFIDGSTFLSYHSKDSSFTSHSYDDKSYYSSNIRKDNYYNPGGDG